MNTLFLIATIAVAIAYFLFEENRKKIRIALIVLLIADLIIYLSPTARCAVNLPMDTWLTFNPKAIAFRHDMCMLSQSVEAMQY